MNSSLSNIVTPLLNWYHTYARTLPWRQSPSAYHIWVSEIMLQQTRVEAVKHTIIALPQNFQPLRI